MLRGKDPPVSGGVGDVTVYACHPVDHVTVLWCTDLLGLERRPSLLEHPPPRPLLAGLEIAEGTTSTRLESGGLQSTMLLQLLRWQCLSALWHNCKLSRT